MLEENCLHLSSHGRNVDDRKPVPDLTKDLIGKLFGSRGYISQELFDKLYERGLELITRRKI